MLFVEDQKMRLRCTSIAVRATAAAGALVIPSSALYSDPIVRQPGYRIDLVVTDAGAVDGMTLSPSGDLFLTDYAGGRILKVTNPSAPGLPKTPTVVASGIPYPTDVAFSSFGQLFVTSSTQANSPLYAVDPGGTFSQFATGFSFPTSISARGNDLFVSDSGDGTIRRVGPDRIVHDFLSGVGAPYGLSFDASGNLYFADHETGRVFRSDLSGNYQPVGTVSSLGSTFTAVDRSGRPFVSDTLAAMVDLLGADGTITPFATGFLGKSNPPVIRPTGLVSDPEGHLYVGDGPNVWRISLLLIGDANGDGSVGFDDLLVLAQHYGLIKTATLADGDFNGDGTVVFFDLELLAQHFGQTAGTGTAISVAPVPEPVALLPAGWLGVILLRRKRRG